MDLSVIIPAYNEEGRIRKSIIRLNSYLAKHFKRYQIIVVNDGSSDRTQEILHILENEINTLQAFHFKENHGKGFAVRKGVKAANGNLIVFTDADLSTPVQEIGNFAKKIGNNQNMILIGSRNVPGAKIKIKQPCYRAAMGRIFNWSVRVLTKLPFRDTQCGFKMFPKKLGKEIFSKTKENGFVFDIEVLLLAQKMNCQILETPICWVNNAKSKIRLFRDSIQMFRDLTRISSMLKHE